VGRDEGDSERSRALAPELPALDARAPADPDASTALASALWTLDPTEASAAVVAAVGDGASLATVLDALRLLGSEAFARRPGRRSNTGRTRCCLCTP